MVAKTAHVITHNNSNITKQTVISTRDEMNQKQFDTMMRQGLKEAKANHSQHVKDAFMAIRKQINK